MTYVSTYNLLVSSLLQATSGLQAGQSLAQATTELRANWDQISEAKLLAEPVQILQPVVISAAQSEETPELRRQVFTALSAASSSLGTHFDHAKFQELSGLIAQGVSPLHSAIPPTQRTFKRRPSQPSMIHVDPAMIPPLSESETETDELVLPLRAIIESLAVAAGIFVVGNEGVGLMMCNKANEEISGFTEKELTEQDFMQNIHPEDLPRFAPHLPDIFSGGLFVNDVRLLTRDGSYVDVDLYARIIRDQNFGLYFCIDRSGSKRAVAALRVSYDALEERVAKEAAEREVERLAILSEVATGIAHDVQNGHQALSMQIAKPRRLLEIFRDLLVANDDGDASPAIQLASQKFGRMPYLPNRTEFHQAVTEQAILLAIANMLLELLNYPQETIEEIASRIESLRTMQSGAGQAYPFQISEMISIEELQSILTDDRVQLRVGVPDPSPMIRADPVRFREVIKALMQNAVDAMQEQGKRELIVSVASIQLDREAVDQLPYHRLNRSNIRLGRFVRISVKDTGHGIPEEQLLEVFKFRVSSHNDPTLEENRRGFGLSIVQSIMNESKGFITVESSVGKGSSFTLYLPETDLEFEAGNLIG